MSVSTVEAKSLRPAAAPFFLLFIAYWSDTMAFMIPSFHLVANV